jgi:hypothetical protein
MPRAPKKCGRPGCELRVVGRIYCDEHTAELQRRDNTTARGYGAPHQQKRADWAPIVATGTVRCWRCGELIAAGEEWDLGHDDHDRRITRGPEHRRRCNRATSSRRARPPDPYASK